MVCLTVCRGYAILMSSGGGDASHTQHLKQMTAIHTLTNGYQNFIFEIREDGATIWTINVFGGLEHEEERTIDQARYQWQMALKHGCKRGWTVSQYREQPSAFDDNRWEEELALAQG